MNESVNYYKKRTKRILNYFDHVSWCGISDVKSFITDWINETNASDMTWYHRVVILINYHKWLVSNHEIPSKSSVLKYYDEKRKSGVRESSLRTFHIQIKAFFNYLNQNDIYPEFMSKVKAPYGEYQEKTCLKASEVNLLLPRITDIRDKTIISLMVLCGLRCVEIAEMQWGDILNDRLTVRGKCRKDKSTVIVLPVSVQSLLLDLKKKTTGKTDDESYVFISEKRKNKQPLSPFNVSKLVRYILKEKLPEVAKITPHGLRHTAITLAVESGMDIHRVAHFARHKSIATTSVYLHDNEKYSDPVVSHIETLVNQSGKHENPVDQLKEILLKILKS